MRNMAMVFVLLFVFLSLSNAFAKGNKEQPTSSLVGNVLPHPVAAADFVLTDQHGVAFRMAETRGKVVLLSFIYTHCTDICPFEAVKVKEVYGLLGKDADEVAFVAVTTDPKRDVPRVTSAYSRALGLLDVWRFVGGPVKAVQDVWASYGIGVSVDPATGAAAAAEEKHGGSAGSTDAHEVSGGGSAGAGLSQGLSSEDLALAGEIIQRFGGGYDVGHSAPFWIVDRKGLVRVGMDGDALPAEIVTNIRALLAERPSR